MTKLGIAGCLLERRSRGITTLHHYKRISSRDLGWHRRENGRGREEVKLNCFFDKRVKPQTLKVEQFIRKSTTEMNEIANNPVEKRNKVYYENLKVAKT